MKIVKPGCLVAIRVMCALAISAVILSFPLYSLTALFNDLQFQARPFQHKLNNILTVAVDQKTLTALKGEPRLAAHNAVLYSLLQNQPLAIYYTLDPRKIVAAKNDRATFVGLIQSFNNAILYTDDLPNRGEDKKLLLGGDFGTLKFTPGSLSSDYQHFSEDGVARRALLSDYGYTFAQVIAANLINPIPLQDYRGAFEFSGSRQINVNYQRPGTYAPISFLDILQNKIPLSTFKNKIVLIGTDTNFDYGDYFKSVYNHSNFAMSKLEAQANIIATLVANDGLIDSPFWFDALMTVLFSLLVAFSVFRVTPAKGLLIIVSAIVAYTFAAWFLFSFFGVAIAMAQPILAIFACYYLFIPYRLIQENKKFWELTQKNKLLTQVEELKNNFLSLMSHDLKTPLARIQGMADMALSSEKNLLPAQKNAIETIKQSADELTEFISSILDLSRVESQEIKLNLQSKDVNRLLEDVIQKYEYLTVPKNIQVITEFETLFSVKVDADLMRQVFSNLVENAIKYSPENSKILVTTEEADGHIIVQVADQGIGISENEIKSIFSKFFRTKNVKNSQIKGSGLGLYLAKYFVELHKGRISVESLPQQGSTFTVGLPMNLEREL